MHSEGGGRFTTELMTKNKKATNKCKCISLQRNVFNFQSVTKISGIWTCARPIFGSGVENQRSSSVCFDTSMIGYC